MEKGFTWFTVQAKSGQQELQVAGPILATVRRKKQEKHPAVQLPFSFTVQDPSQGRCLPQWAGLPSLISRINTTLHRSAQSPVFRLILGSVQLAISAITLYI